MANYIGLDYELTKIIQGVKKTPQKTHSMGCCASHIELKCYRIEHMMHDRSSNLCFIFFKHPVL